MKTEMPPKVAVVLCGGGARGAIEVGLYWALQDLKIPIDLVVGTSVGAINGAFIAAGASPEAMAEVWQRLRARDFFGFNWQVLWKLWRADSVFTTHRFRRFLEKHLPARSFEELKLPLVVTGTNLHTGHTLYWDQGNLLEPILASTALPGLFPPIHYHGAQVVDGGISDNVPIDVAIQRGAETVIFMLCVCCQRFPYPASGLIQILSRAFSIALDMKYRSDLRHYRKSARLIVLEPPLDSESDLFDFRNSERLITGAREFALEQLRSEGF